MQTLASQIVVARPSRAARLATDVLLVVGGSLLVAGLAQLSIRLPFTPVPITGQTLGVLLVGASLGAARGLASMLLYLAEGAVGLPFFAEGKGGWEVLTLATPSGGYLFGFVAAAALVGFLSQRGWDRSLRSCIGAMLLGEVVIYLCGLPWLAASVGVPATRALELGLYPFVVGDLLKLFVAAGALPAAWRLTRPSWRGGSA
ncbi:MAG TPA: biotin transporter BioY [Actinomycetota bacterium]|nr:biotin transporter BioY [Actinomycetota bacterium]